ncbi:IS66 family transposase [Escherichia coli]|uniref:IS66 family transposase n=1 Tax=Escherichia coli TaxID=562 RepID=UPI0026BAB6EF
MKNIVRVTRIRQKRSHTLLKQWEALNVYCSNGWVEIDNNIAENALRGVAVGRKNWLFAGSDSRWRTCGGVVLADRHMPSEQCGTRKMAALRH